jgi:predicted phosphate transport protein (TIGR00153 family)
MSFISNLMPKQGQFFDLFNRHGELIVAGGKALFDLLQDYDNSTGRAGRIAQIEELEHSADKITHETVALLHKTFVTPFDRDDIHRLISRMDDILDLIQDTAETLVLYDIQKLTPEASHLANIVQLCCERVNSAVKLLVSMDNAAAAIKIAQEIDGLESDADRVMRAAVSKLFRDETDVRQLIKLKALYELLEEATDKCQDVANVIEGVVLENA